MHYRQIAFVLTLLLGAAATSADAQVTCTKERLAELEDDLTANRDMRRWTTDQLRPVCRAIDRAENIAGKVLSPFGGEWLKEYVLQGLDPKITSNLCRYMRKKGEQVLTPEEDEQALIRSIERCRAQLNLEQ